MKALRGMKDILPPQSKKYLHFLNTASNLAQNWGFEYIETPILEETALFKRSVGESSDIVGKEMYQFTDKGGNDVVLRPEGTAGVVRSFIEHKMDKKGGIHRFYYYGPMFRYERPQKGRLREFHQFGIESFGEASAYEDANIILLAKAILDSYNIAYTLKINSLGCPACMPNYKKELINFLKTQELCFDCQRREVTNPIRVLDCKNPSCQENYKNAPKLTDYLCKECQDEFALLQKLLKKSQVEFEIDPNLVRGLDYYTRSAFEFVSGALGAQSAIAGGGRYDNLVAMLGGKPTPAVGFAIGIERILELIDIDTQKREGFFMGSMLDEGVEKLFLLANKKRKKDRVIVEYKPKSLKALLKAADRNLARYAVIVGEDELKEDKLWVKDLEEKREFFITPKEFLEL